VVVLAGPANAGKSTLFNLLVGHERVVVDESGGTTRDAIRERCLLGDYAIDLVDTAGMRPVAGESTEAVLDRAGQELGRRARERADLVLWLSRDPDRERESRGSVPRVDITSAADLLDEEARARAPAPLSVHADSRGARPRVEELFHTALSLPRSPWTPGEAVPFSRDLRERLERVRGATGESSRRSALDALIAR